MTLAGLMQVFLSTCLRAMGSLLLGLQGKGDTNLEWSIVIYATRQEEPA